MIHRVSALNGNRQTKKERTTVPSISITCFLYLTTWPLLELFVFWAIITGFSIKFLAITLYSTNRTPRGKMKNTAMVRMKNKADQKVSACVRQTGTREPSSYSS